MLLAHKTVGIKAFQEVVVLRKSRSKREGTSFSEVIAEIVIVSVSVSRGASEQNLKRRLIQNALFQFLKEENIKQDTFAAQAVPYDLKFLALEAYKVNFLNIWTDKVNINKLLDKVLMVLLRSHLAPGREV